MASRDADICCWRQPVVFLSSPLRGVSLNYEGSLWPASGCGSLWWGRGASPPSTPVTSLLLEGFSSSSALWYSCWPSEKSPGSFRTLLSLGQIVKCIFEALRTCMEKSASEAGSPLLLKEAAGACVNIPGVAWKSQRALLRSCSPPGRLKPAMVCIPLGSWVATSVCILGNAQRHSIPPSSDSLLLRSAKTPEISQWWLFGWRHFLFRVSTLLSVPEDTPNYGSH